MKERHYCGKNMIEYITSINWDFFLDMVITGFTIGSIYALIALGYTMVYGIIALINFAHGEIYMLGAFVALSFSMILGLEGMTGWALLISVLVIAVIYCALYGWTLEKLAYKPLRKASRLAPLISAIGMSIFLQQYVQLGQTKNFVVFPTLIPEMAFLDDLPFYLGSTNFVIFVTSIIVMSILTFLIKFTRMGTAMRATAQDMQMAMLTGVSVNRVISTTFIIGSSLAAVGGVLIGCHMGQINATIGFLAGLKAFTAAVLGGIGSIPGAVLGAMVLGFAESFAAGYISSDYKDVIAFILLILILIVKPSGLLGKQQTQKV